MRLGKNCFLVVSRTILAEGKNLFSGNWEWEPVFIVVRCIAARRAAGTVYEFYYYYYYYYY